MDWVQMSPTELVLQTLRQNFSYLSEEYGVARLGLFGSYAKGTADETSDVDIIIEFQHPVGFKFVELTEYLERLLGHRVDVLTPAGLSSIRLPGIATDIADNILYVETN